MMRRIYTNVIWSVCVIGFSAGLMGCEASEDEQAVLSVVNDGIALLEEENLTKTMRLTTKDFLVQPGKLNRGAATTRLYNFFRSYDGLTILHPELEVERSSDGQSAQVSVPFAAVRRGASVEELEAVRDDPEAWIKAARRLTTVKTVDVSLVKKGDRWLIRTVRFR